jgi:CBS domain-containing protein
MGNYHLRAEEIMQVEVATVLDDATAAEAASQMRLEGVRSLIVKPRDESEPYGIIAYTDIVDKVLAEGHDPEAVRVYEIMTKPALTVAPDTPVQDIARLFRAQRFGHAPVVDGGKLLGVVSKTDLVTEVVTEPR